MTKTALISLLLLTGAPALAQTTQPAGPPDTTAPTTPPAAEQSAEPATTTTGTTTSTTTTTAPTDQPAADATAPATDAPATDATAPATGAAPADATAPAADAAAPATAEASKDPVVAAVDTDWAKYDSNSNASLSRAEFNKWVTDLQTAAGKKAPTRSYLSDAFRKADADKNKAVSKDELTAFLRG